MRIQTTCHRVHALPPHRSPAPAPRCGNARQCSPSELSDAADALHTVINNTDLGVQASHGCTLDRFLAAYPLRDTTIPSAATRLLSTLHKTHSLLIQADHCLRAHRSPARLKDLLIAEAAAWPDPHIFVRQPIWFSPMAHHYKTLEQNLARVAASFATPTSFIAAHFTNLSKLGRDTLFQNVVPHVVPFVLADPAADPDGCKAVVEQLLDLLMGQVGYLSGHDPLNRSGREKLRLAVTQARALTAEAKPLLTDWADKGIAPAQWPTELQEKMRQAVLGWPHHPRQ